MTWSLLFFVILIISVFIQLIYQLFFFNRLILYKPKKLNNKTKPVSVVLCAKDEYSNLKKNLRHILEQKYPEFEVIVVNDRSTDNTKNYLEEIGKKHANLKVINIINNVNFFKGKKLPLSVGIKSSKYKTLLLTDADCRPASPLWLNNMQKNFVKQTEIVLGYGAYEKKKGFLNEIIRYDTLTIAMNYFSLALAGIPYMGVGRNLAYNKDLFYKAGGFTSHYTITSGDDDLFINYTANSKNTAIEINPDSFTVSEPKNTFEEWFVQKRRHFLTGNYYKNKHKILLGLLSLSDISFYLSLLFVMFFTPFWLWGIIMFIIRLLCKIINYYYIGKKFQENILFLNLLIFDILFSFLSPIIYISNIIYRKNKWK